MTDGISKIPNIKSPDPNKIRNLNKKIGQKKFYEETYKIRSISKNKFLATDTQSQALRAYEPKKIYKKINL